MAKQIEELTQKLHTAELKASVKADPVAVGLFGNPTGTIVRPVYMGTGKGVQKSYFTLNPGGTSRKYLKDAEADNWVFMDKEAVMAAVAAHDEKMDNLKKSSPAK